MGNEGALERTQISVHQSAAIAENEARQPGRKLLIWVGPGWPMLQSQNFTFSERDRRRYFDVIVELTNRLREARIVVYSVAPADSSLGGGPGRSQLYKAFLKPVTTRHAPGNMQPAQVGRCFRADQPREGRIQTNAARGRWPFCRVMQRDRAVRLRQKSRSRDDVPRPNEAGSPGAARRLLPLLRVPRNC